MSSIVLISKHFFSYYILSKGLLNRHFIRSTTSCLLMVLLVFSPGTNTWAAENLQAKEYLVKSAFLYNFARLSEWPEGILKTNSEPFKLCIMGNDSFGVALNSIREKHINGHPLQIQRRITLDEATECQIVFISRSEEKQLSDILTYLRSYPVMTVSELPGFAQQGGHIRLFLNDENTLSLEINLQAIRQAQLKISSRILTLATIVKTGKAVESYDD